VGEICHAMIHVAFLSVARTLSVFICSRRYFVYTAAGASKGTPGDANCVTKIVGGDKIRAQGGTVYIFMCEKEKFSVQCICQSFSDTIT